MVDLLSATPRPWAIKPIYTNPAYTSKEVWIDDAEGRPVLLCSAGKAALIVQAVNSFDVMLGALKAAQKALAMITDETHIKATSVAGAWASCVETEAHARKAIAIADGHSS